MMLTLIGAGPRGLLVATRMQANVLQHVETNLMVDDSCSINFWWQITVTNGKMMHVKGAQSWSVMVRLRCGDA